jgi:hypothetical protein
MLFESFGQTGQSSLGVIVTHRPSSGFPDMLLRIKIRRGGWEHYQLQARMRRQQRANLLTALPGRTIPQQQERYVRIRFQECFQIIGGRFGSHVLDFLGLDLAGLQIQCTIKAGLGAARIAAHRQWLTARPSDHHGGGLKIQCGFVHCQNHRLRRLLRGVDQFFSIWISKSATATSLRDLNTWLGR